jgi:hypothetical protein
MFVSSSAPELTPDKNGRRFAKHRLKQARRESTFQTIAQRTDRMSQTFAEIVEVVQQLSLAEKEQLQELLRKYLIEERRGKIRAKQRRA